MSLYHIQHDFNATQLRVAFLYKKIRETLVILPIYIIPHTKRVTYNTSADAAHYEQGRVDGRATANSRSLEG